MKLHIRDPRARMLAGKIAAAKGITLTQAVIMALENEVRRLEEERQAGLSGTRNDWGAITP